MDLDLSLKLFKYLKVRNIKSNMFQNSFVTRLNIRCPIHYNNRITYVCSQPQCKKNTLLCDQCINSKIKQSHYGHEFELKKVDKYLQTITETISSIKPSIQRLYRSISSQKQNQTLLSWQKEKSQHYESIRNHLKTLKFQIEEEISNIVARFEQELNREKQNMYNELEAYISNYEDKFSHFTRVTEPIVLTYKQYAYYQSKNNLSLKMMSLEPLKLTQWLNQVKSNLYEAGLSAKSEIDYINRVRTLGLVTNELMDELPRIRNLDLQKQLPLVISQSCKNILDALIQFRRGKIPSTQNQKSSNPNQTMHIMRSTSMNYIATNDNSRSASVNQRDSIRQRKYYNDK